MKQTEFKQIVSSLQAKIRKLDSSDDNFQNWILAAINLCASAYNELRDSLVKNGFNSTEEEIQFFKVIKPNVLGEYLFYSKLFEIKTKIPVASVKKQKKFLRSMIFQGQQFFKENNEFYQYYRSGSDHLDDKYFVRTKTICSINPYHIAVDLFFSTSHDYTLATIKANERIIAYCTTAINNLKTQKLQKISQSGVIQIKTNLFWTGSKTALIELIYAIHSTGVINNGKADIKELVNAFETILNIKLSRFYHTFFEMRLRKFDRTSYLDLMKKCLIKRMDDADEK